MDSIVTGNIPELELTDFDAERRLLELPGTSLLVFTSTGCASCRWARRELSGMALPVDRLCWVDAGRNGGLVQRYEVFHLPSLFLVRDGLFHGAVHSRLSPPLLAAAITITLNNPTEELP
ncbi:thioredoxin family protein [Pseudomonas sp. PDM14]|uniref:thioredoxin family protein n=1 Tax=Pseudomonas sp. PDM14 TaxID=2769288 RepID=UPI00177F3644|nr:thioredoxin family protein [Pseudomonas sp. PDM14]